MVVALIVWHGRVAAVHTLADDVDFEAGKSHHRVVVPRDDVGRESDRGEHSPYDARVPAADRGRHDLKMLAPEAESCIVGMCGVGDRVREVVHLLEHFLILTQLFL